jgi:hypothetical protein
MNWSKGVLIHVIFIYLVLIVVLAGGVISFFYGHVIIGFLLTLPFFLFTWLIVRIRCGREDLNVKLLHLLED